MAAQLEIIDVEQTFGGRGANTRALDRVNLTIEKGEFIALLGPSGCGKSTLLNVIAGFLRPTAGRVLQDGAEIRGPDSRRTVVFQDYALFPWMTVQQNVEFGLKARGVGAAERAKIARAHLAAVQLSGFEERYPYEVSGGMKQRAAIARALAPDPAVLLMDEPFGALDAQTRVLLQEEVARVSAQTGKTVIFVTHSIEEAVFLGDRVIVMSARPGRIRREIRVPLGRPRGPEARRDPAFVSLTQDLWEALKPEWEKESAA